MIREMLVSTLKNKFPENKMQIGTPPQPIVTFVAKHPDVGNLTILDDGDEATVCIGHITHGHFNPYDSSLTDEQLTVEITDSVTAFLERLFNDRVFLWKSSTGGAGGWRILKDGEPLPAWRHDQRAFLWSGPIDGRE